MRFNADYKILHLESQTIWIVYSAPNARNLMKLSVKLCLLGLVWPRIDDWGTCWGTSTEWVMLCHCSKTFFFGLLLHALQVLDVGLALRICWAALLRRAMAIERGAWLGPAYEWISLLLVMFVDVKSMWQVCLCVDSFSAAFTAV